MIYFTSLTIASSWILTATEDAVKLTSQWKVSKQQRWDYIYVQEIGTHFGFSSIDAQRKLSSNLLIIRHSVRISVGSTWANKRANTKQKDRDLKGNSEFFLYLQLFRTIFITALRATYRQSGRKTGKPLRATQGAHRYHTWTALTSSLHSSQDLRLK